MTAGWVAAATRGRALLRRQVGADQARLLAGLDWGDARRALSSTVHGKDLAPDTGRSDARRAASAATAWQLRVLAGWLPPNQSGLARAIAAPLEIANIERHLASLTGARGTGASIPLGSLAVAWPRVAQAPSAEMVRTVLATSVWGDPGGSDRASLALGLRLGWARRLAAQSPTVEPWAKGGAAVLIARERFAFERTVNDSCGRVADLLLGTRWRTAGSVVELASRLSEAASWPLDGVEEPAALWRAEAAVARRVAAEATRMATTGTPSRETVIGIMTSMLIDLHRVLTVIELAGRGPDGLEVFDAVA